MNWLDKLIIKLFKWKFYKKFDTVQQYYVTILRDLNDDYSKMYLSRKGE